MNEFNEFNELAGIKLPCHRNLIYLLSCFISFLIFTLKFKHDVDEIDLSLTEYKSLDEFLNDAFITCEKENAFIWSVYPACNVITLM